MKKLLFLSFAIIAMVATSCDLFDDLDDVEFDADYTASYNVAVTGDSARLDQIINLKDDPEVAKYQSKLKKVIVDSVYVSIEGYTGAPNNKLNGFIRYSEVTSTTPLLFTQISNLALENGSKAKVPVTQATIASVESIMKDKKEIKVYLRGKASSSATFTLKVKFYLTIQANALD